jgi:hypothetical protein
MTIRSILLLVAFAVLIAVIVWPRRRPVQMPVGHWEYAAMYYKSTPQGLMVLGIKSRDEPIESVYYLGEGPFQLRHQQKSWVPSSK